jgi:hypothetical protein
LPRELDSFDLLPHEFETLLQRFFIVLDDRARPHFSIRTSDDDVVMSQFVAVKSTGVGTSDDVIGIMGNNGAAC